MQWNIPRNYGSIVNVYFIYEMHINCLILTVKLTKKNNWDKYAYSHQVIDFGSH